MTRDRNTKTGRSNVCGVRGEAVDRNSGVPCCPRADRNSITVYNYDAQDAFVRMDALQRLLYFGLHTAMELLKGISRRHKNGSAGQKSSLIAWVGSHRTNRHAE